jgi:hypothetical protein
MRLQPRPKGLWRTNDAPVAPPARGELPAEEYRENVTYALDTISLANYVELRMLGYKGTELHYICDDVAKAIEARESDVSILRLLLDTSKWRERFSFWPICTVYSLHTLIECSPSPPMLQLHVGSKSAVFKSYMMDH